MTPNIIDATNLGRVFATAAGPVHALRDASICVRGGELVSIVGPSGSGKSTLLHILGLMDRPTRGTHLLDGHNVDALSDKRRSQLRAASLGFVFQSFHLIAHLSAVENVMLPLVYQRSARGQRRARARIALAQVGLAHRAHAAPTTLSGGESQRVAIARAVVHAPRLILCDEPTGNLDRTNAQHILGLLRNIAGDGPAVVIVTHDHMALDATDRVLTMDDGVLLAGRSTRAGQRNDSPMAGAS